ncbi:MAG: diaminopimelate decarboxylase [Candidatus Aureabacteria bacterium]|nr:diaminopimelate decarboxylase [Candidatus Auribacterota bacterium]
MQAFTFKGDSLYCEDVKCTDIAEKYGTPVYVYSHGSFTRSFSELQKSFSSVPNLVCYSVKTCSNLSILKMIHDIGGGFDIVSIGELRRVFAATGDVSKCVFAGVGKREYELTEALEKGIYSFTVESEQELEMLNKCAKKLDKKASFALRINPDVDPKTHKYISTGKKENKFGIDMKLAFELYKKSCDMEFLLAEGIHMHIGSQITTIDPYVEAVKKMSKLISDLKNANVPIEYFDIGGGFGIIYNDEKPIGSDDIIKELIPLLKDTGLKILLEPGRSIAGNSGILLTKVVYIKNNSVKNFAIVDAGMNDLLRPSLYEAYHKILSITGGAGQKGSENYDVVGPICESGDYLALDRSLPVLQQGDILSVMSAGAYGFSMSSNYNSRTRVPEVMIKGNQTYLIREKENFDDLIKGEKIVKF